MTKSVSFTTPRGSEITISIITERELISDHNFTEACWELELRCGAICTTSFERVEYGEHGPCLKFQAGSRQEGKKTIITYAHSQIPADKLAEVDGLIAEYRAEVSRRLDASIETDRRMAKHDEFARRFYDPKSDL
ncbi:hypothetical protein [Consotaella salsifontis]|uniref:Uncharacterized protein n=1 Tax=Consotaella salsifontis TaxID=1365950 RepID=A0A1T4SSC3_9HYPH|nr:hypothetical protein [Consotaella salsifontis]SKA31139.1 hypothetical protein SAMN05428963_113123 [Consotaella salsifontis]